MPCSWGEVQISSYIELVVTILLTCPHCSSHLRWDGNFISKLNVGGGEKVERSQDNKMFFTSLWDWHKINWLITQLEIGLETFPIRFTSFWRGDHWSRYMWAVGWFSSPLSWCWWFSESLTNYTSLETGYGLRAWLGFAWNYFLISSNALWCWVSVRLMGAEAVMVQTLHSIMLIMIKAWSHSPSNADRWYNPGRTNTSIRDLPSTTVDQVSVRIARVDLHN